MNALLAQALAHHKAGQWAEAEAIYRRILVIEPGHADCLHLLGVLSAQTGADASAELWIRQALVHRPNYPEAHLNLANLLRQNSRLDEATEHYQQALVLRPHFAEAHAGLGLVLYQQNQLEKAASCHRQALALRPDDATTHKNYGWVLLKQGDLAAGFREYEWRWKIKDFPVKPPPFRQPWWDGGDLTGRTLLLHAEQGFGDTLQFIRYAPMLRQRGAQVILECPHELKRLLKGLDGLDYVFGPGDERPDFDLHAPLLSLPYLFGTTLATVPAPTPYLAPPPGLAAVWAERLPPTQGPRVGLVWAGNPRRHQPDWTAVDRRRSLALELLSPLGQSLGIQWVSLQKDRRPELEPPSLDWNLIDLMPDVTDFADTAALIANLDLVIGVDTAVLHLAAAQGKPAWLLSRFDGCWRWLHDRNDSPWYPSLRLFRQSQPDDWESVIINVKNAFFSHLEIGQVRQKASFLWK